MSTEELNYDVLIIGAGPAGLAAAIKIKQLAADSSSPIDVCVIDKAAELGGHTLSGAVIDTTSLSELMPDWRDQKSPINIKVMQDKFHFFTEQSAITIPNYLLPNTLKNKDCYVVSLSNVVKWLGKRAEMLGVDIFTGFAAKELIFDKNNALAGIKTGEFGIDSKHEKKNSYSPSIIVKAKFSLIAEGSRGHLGKELISRYKLDENCSPQNYSLGIKELWKLPDSDSRPGDIFHGFGWPLKNIAYGGSFAYHMDKSLLSIGLIVGLNYKNPWLSPFQEFQKFKKHPKISKLIKNGKRIGYGARTLTTGGLFSLPKLSFPGGGLIGCDAGFLNPAKIKGTHTAIKSGILAAEGIMESLKGVKKSVRENSPFTSSYQKLFFSSSLHEELKESKNFKAYMNFGFFLGGALFKAEQLLLFKKPFFNFKLKKADHLYLDNKNKHEKITYEKPDGKLSFDRLSSLPFSGTSHQENQPTHLLLKNSILPLTVNLPIFGGPETRYCPAEVYEYLSSEGQPTNNANSAAELRINAQNCLHCKACDVKDPTQNINWITPEGGGGPNYKDM